MSATPEPPIDGSRLSDAAARRRIREDLDTSLMCLAGAGAGKTHALVERMVACVRSGTADVGHMAAITFTRKAAGELRGRFFLALQDAATAAEQEAQGRAGARELARLLDAVTRVDQCFIGTIHAFCARLLRERPVEAGLPPDFREVEEREEVWLARDAWDRFLEARSAAGDERLLAIEDTGLTAERFYQFYIDRCQYSDLALKPTAASRPDLQAAVIPILDLIRDVAAQIPSPLPDGRRDNLMTVVERQRPLVELGGPVSDAECEVLLRAWQSRSGTDPILKCWGPKGSESYAWAQGMKRDVLPALRQQVVLPTLAAWRRHVYTLAGDLVDEAMASYRDRRRATATLTFNDLLEDTAALLRDRADVCAAFGQRWRRLFVDEFQDTDPLQAEIVLRLAAEDAADVDWRRLRPRPGSLFLVGDEKQSIYRFRRADVDIFRLVRQRLRESGGAEVELTTCFRARPEVTSWVNGAFEPLFDNHDPRYQADFQRLQAPRPVGAGAGVYRLPTGADAGDRSARVAQEATRIATFIAAALRGDTALNGDDTVLGARAEPGDFLVITRARRHLGAYARALEALDVPYDITGAGSLRDSRELRAVVDGLDAVLRGDDPVPLLAYLRGPLVGLGDNELYRLRQAGWGFRWWHPLPAGLEPDLEARATEALAQLRRLRVDLEQRPPAAALELWLERTGLLAYAAVGEAGSSRAGNLLRVLALVRDAQGRRGLGWAQITQELRDMLEEERVRVEAMTLETGRADVVRIMNLHQAKGLEARVVFLADPADASGSRHGVDVHVSRTAEPPHLSMAVTETKGRGRFVLAEPEGWEADAAEEARFLEAESLRLVYVAATRAADVLVVGSEGGRGGAWAVLEGALSDAPELPIPATALPWTRPGATSQVAPRPDRKAAWDLSLQPGYALERVTEEDEAGPWLGEGEATGRGRDYGSVVHRLLEHEVRGQLAGMTPDELRACVGSMLREAGNWDAQLEAAALASLAAFRTGPLATELAVAGDQVFAEVPVADVRDAPGGLPTVRRGVIDLVYRVTGGGWKIVDYKTHRSLTEDLRELYARQVGCYAQHWETVRGEPVVERGLWLAAGDGADRYLKL